jgi:hypothetical protein
VNLFILHANPEVAARMMCDSHVVKMPTETAQMLSTVARLHGVNIGYKIAHPGHPCTKWIGASKANFDWAVRHGIALCQEYTMRYLSVHGARSTIEAVRDIAFLIRFKRKGRTPFAQAMPDEYKDDNAVLAYRKYYVGDKARFAKWTAPGKEPKWWKEMI